LWGVFDMPFYLYMAEKLESFKQPFFVSVFNLTSHHPFVVPSDYQNKVPKGHTVEQPCVAYTDMSIRAFFEKAKNSAWFKNTIFVFVEDHVSSEVYAEQTKTPKGNMAIFMYTSDQSLKGKNYHTTQQVDIMPTLLGLIGNQKPYFAIGRDVFNEKDRMPIATNFINQLFQCITDFITIYFDGEKVQSAFANKDTLQNNNIINQNLNYQQQAENQLKAILQIYYDRLHKKDYTISK
ncbi:MAG: LTA synthase family protein, partial [Chitinophagaceae bacterium]